MTMQDTETGWRGSAELWLSAAHDALLEGGVDAVKIMPLAKKLKLSRASFYWFFQDREQLLAALLKLWRDKNTGNLVMRANAYADSLAEAILNVSDCWFDNGLFDSRLEFAIRSWAIQSADIRAEVQEADRQRLDALTDLFSRFGMAPKLADVRARTIYLVQIGYISMQTEEDICLRTSRMPEYVEVYTGVPPQPRELNRFFSRHGLKFEDGQVTHA